MLLKISVITIFINKNPHTDVNNYKKINVIFMNKIEYVP